METTGKPQLKGEERVALPPVRQDLRLYPSPSQRDAAQFLQGGEADEWVMERIAAREAARRRKDFPAADGIRRELLAKGIVLEDKGGKTTWRRQ